jgi:hypothetical protein
MNDSEEIQRRLLALNRQRLDLAVRLERQEEKVNRRLHTISCDRRGLEVEARQFSAVVDDLGAVTAEIETLNQALKNLTDKAA